MAAVAAVIDASGATTGEQSLDDGLFGGEVNSAVLHQVVVAQLAAARSGTASTKTRAEVRGGGRKPWRQKGTGRARHGSIRSPIWVGGGAVFGPKPRSYVQRVNKKVRQAALRSALADKAGSERIFILDGFDQTKTKAAHQCLEVAGITGKVLIVVDSSSEGDEAVDLAFRNLAHSAFSLQGSLAAYDIVAAEAVVFTSGAYERFVERAGNKVASR
ncbi:MAG TPA: 50S ribosomal protein L4 [Actinomycetota bacterium]|nr:50S ribosomal protein L4 [Actinomycetota bacterium]